ncbi:nucleolar and coiled-body phosphoprotein 1-like isoform X2 [Daphnia carinata]|uniref:nucleolar and coiled-body phosphoprotein 1-like isoform X2 n=1 Tax=Daphnia carinata TaxID=120202 RepID=UPI00257B0B77|nr:nucleolar and coiled-body phosphoprotein 1-like isoform X2 [Daphnia carinata]
MTILAAIVKAGTMEKLMDPVTSDSELEEGEIANDEIEIISEIIHRPPIKPQMLNSGKSVLETNLVSSRKPDSFTETRLHSSKHAGSGTNSGGNNGKIELKPIGGLKPTQRSSREKSSVPSKRKSPPNTLKRLGQSRSRLDSNSSSRNRFSGSRSNRERVPSNQVRKEEKPGNSVTIGSEDSKDKRWKQSFELITPGSVESMEEDSGSDDDEEIKLRIEALNSVVANAKPKENLNSDVTIPQINSMSELVISSGIQEGEEGDEEDEDEDEELLRAQLLIEVARKQTKDLEVQMQPEQKDKRVDEPPLLNPVIERRNPPTKAPLKPIHIPKADRLVIDLRNDSSDSSDDEEYNMENSISALLKTVRKTVEEKNAAIPHALSHLPRNQQEEYQRLKQEIRRRENELLKQGAPKVPTCVPPQLDNISKGDSSVSIQHSAPQESRVGSTATGSEKPILVPSKTDPAQSAGKDLSISSPKPCTKLTTSRRQSPTIPPPTIPFGTNAKENERSVENNKKLGETLAAKPHATSTPRASDGPKTKSPLKSNESSSPKLIALKQQLLHKKRDLAMTKETLKNQLGLVDKNRLLWLNSSQEVNRLRALLQTAEETERQLRTQLTNSQLQTQRLKTKMQSIERQVTVLNSGIGTHRTRRVSAKFRPKLTTQPGLNSSAANFILPPLTPLRVKPRVFAKALAKTNHLTYRKPTEAAIDSAVSIKGAVQTKTKQSFPNVLEGSKILHDEHWLYGTLGDDWSHPNNISSYPIWSPHGHASRFLNEEFRLDSSLVVCRFQLDSTCCQMVPCPFQHLPQTDARRQEKSSPVVSKNTARLATLALLQLTF